MTALGARQPDLEALYRERFRAFLFAATAVLGDGEAALDAVQDAFALALRRRRSFRGDGSLEAWVWRIVLNVARDRCRARARGLRPPEVAPPEATADEPEDDVRALLLALPERQRVAVFLRYYADLSYAQIAEALGSSPGTVAASLNAAHRALRRKLGEVAR
jgi:RNA polymerase sigma factor (sigma-70 family)